MGPEDKTVQKCLSFLLRTQCRNGAWWSRLTCGYPSEAEEIRKGYDFLLRAMKQGGCWEDDQVNFTIFPKTFYYRYPFMNSIIPLNALTAYLIATERKKKE